MKRSFFSVVFTLLVLSAFTQVSGEFIVKGDINTYYPVAFTDNGGFVATELNLGRSFVHQDGNWRGAFISKFRFHANNWGSGAAFIDADIKQNTSAGVVAITNFIGGWIDASTANSSFQIVIWLRGGTTTYFYNSNYAVNPVIYDGVQNALPFQISGGPAATPKTVPDSYVDVLGMNNSLDVSAGGNIIARGPGLNFFNGKVGIGTSTTGSNTLAVEGTIGARKVVVTVTNPFPDYVFKKEYELPSLDSVSKFIRANSHLPGVISEDSVKKNGLDLGNNQIALLKKIEELILYAIEQNNKAKDQDNLLKLQANEIKELQRQNLQLANLQQQIDALKTLVDYHSVQSK